MSEGHESGAGRRHGEEIEISVNGMARELRAGITVTAFLSDIGHDQKRHGREQLKPAQPFLIVFGKVERAQGFFCLESRLDDTGEEFFFPLFLGT